MVDRLCNDNVTSFTTWNWKNLTPVTLDPAYIYFFCKEYYMRNMRDMNCIEKLHVLRIILLLYFSLISLKRIKKECDIFQHLLCLSTAIFEPYEQLQSMHQVCCERKRTWVETCCLPPRTVNEFTTRCLIFTMVDGRKLWEKSSEQFQWLFATLF